MENKKLEELIKKLKQKSGGKIFNLGSQFSFGGFGNIGETTFRSPVDDIKDMSEIMKLNRLIEKLEKRQRGELPKYSFSSEEIELIQKYNK